MKNAEKLNEIGGELGEKYGVSYLTSDFKKKEGYKRSLELSREYGMYRQDYCGCIFSMREREADKAKKEKKGTVFLARTEEIVVKSDIMQIKKK